MFKWLKQLRCTHWKANLESWSIVSFNSVAVRYKCVDCEKIVHLLLKGKEADDWIKAMGEHKRV